MQKKSWHIDVLRVSQIYPDISWCLIFQENSWHFLTFEYSRKFLIILDILVFLTFPDIWFSKKILNFWHFWIFEFSKKLLTFLDIWVLKQIPIISGCLSIFKNIPDIPGRLSIQENPWHFGRLSNSKSLDKFGHVWTSLDQFGPVWTNFDELYV